jgi:hypothetical protein
MPGLSHYKNSPAGINKHEVLYANLFVATLIPPTGIDGKLLSDQVISIGGLNTEPGSDAITQEFRFAQRSYASGRPQQTTMDLSINFHINLNEANQAYTYKTLQSWARRIYNPQTGEQGLKIDYVGQIIIEMHNRKGDVYRKLTCLDAWITSGIPELGLDNGNGDALQLELTFRTDYWVDEWV